jgi:two-component system response regulator HydG
MRRPVKRFSAETLAALHAYHWPGNVRELRNVVERCTILARSEVITPELLPFKTSTVAPMRPATMTSGTAATATAPEAESLKLRDQERQLVVRALRRTRGNKSQAATLLGVTRKTLDRKYKEYALAPAEFLPGETS